MVTPVNIEKVIVTNWSPQLENFGQIVINTEDIQQTIQIILTTPKGTDPHRPEFASGLFDYVDYPQTAVTPFLIRETTEALERWEPRITLVSVDVNYPPNDLGNTQILVRWRVKGSTIEELTVVEL